MHQTNVKARTSKRLPVNDYMFSLSSWFSKDLIQIVCRADEIYMYMLVRVLNPPFMNVFFAEKLQTTPEHLRMEFSRNRYPVTPSQTSQKLHTNSLIQVPFYFRGLGYLPFAKQSQKNACPKYTTVHFTLVFAFKERE